MGPWGYPQNHPFYGFSWSINSINHPAIGESPWKLVNRHLQRWQVSQRSQAPARLTGATPQQQAEAIEVFFASVIWKKYGEKNKTKDGRIMCCFAEQSVQFPFLRFHAENPGRMANKLTFSSCSASLNSGSVRRPFATCASTSCPSFSIGSFECCHGFGVFSAGKVDRKEQ